MIGFAQVARFSRLVVGEIGWWLSVIFGLLLLLRRRPGRALLWTLVGGLSVIWHGWWLTAVLLAPLVGFGLWARIGPVSFQLRVAEPWWRWGHARWLRKRWAQVM